MRDKENKKQHCLRFYPKDVLFLKWFAGGGLQRALDKLIAQEKNKFEGASYYDKTINRKKR